MPENPKSAVDFLLNGNTPTVKEPSSSSVDFLLEQSKPQNKQAFNEEFDKNLIPLESDPRYTLDPNKYETKFQSGFQDAVNSFWKGIDETQKSINDYDITSAELKIAKNNKILETLPDNDPNKQLLINENIKEFLKIQNATEDKIANQKEIDDEYVSKKYKLNEALVQGQGSDAGLFDKIQYTYPGMIGSSASLIVPSIAATFGTKAAAMLVAPFVGQAAAPYVALTSAAAAITYGRHLETKGEIGSQIQQNKETLQQRYIEDVYNKTGQQITKDQIPQNVLDDIIIQSNNGREEMYWQNMAESIPDLAGAMLFMPKMNLFPKLGKAVSSVTDASKFSRIGSGIGKIALNYEKEKFEEGTQYAFGKRQESFALGTGEYQNEGFIKDLLTDSQDVLTSMNWSPLGEVRGSGRYAEDKQFQTAEESGGALSFIMGGFKGIYDIGKDLNTYRKVNKELQDDGVFNVDDKYFRLKDQILQKHFENGTTHHLLEGVKNLIGKKNEYGTEILTKEQAKEEVDKVQKSFDVYNEVNSQVNEIEKKGAFLMFDSAEQKVAKKAVKNNLFHTSLQLAREQKDLTDLTTKRGNIQNAINDPKLKDYNNISDLVEKQKDVITKLEAFNPMKVIPEAFNIPFRIKAQKAKLKELEAIKKAEEERLTEAGIDFKVEPLTIAEQDLNKQIIAKESLLEEQKDKYKELLKIKDDKSLQDWYSKYTKNKTEAKETADVADAKQKNTEETTEKPIADFSGFEDSENPTDGENVTTPAEGETWYDNITNKDEFFARINEGIKTEQFTEEAATAMVNDWKAKQKAKTAAPKTDWNKIIASAVSMNELDRIIDQIDVEGSMSESLLTSINKKRESLTKKDLTENEVTEKLSNGVTNAFDDNLNTDEVLESNNTSNETSNKEFVSKKPNALMMKFYEFLDKTKKWARHTSGELRGYVIGEYQPGVSMEVNNPNVATEGSEVTYVHNGTDISLVDADGRVVGFMGLGANKPGPMATLDVIEAHKNLLAIRAYVLSQPSGTVKTTVLVKGHGKLLTKMEGNLPVLDQSISQRPEDMIEGRPLFLWDNGSRLVNNNLTEEQAKVAKLFENISFTNSEGIGEGRVYQVVKTANGSWFVIPVYTKVIGQTADAEKTINTIISILKGAIADGKTINYQKALQQLNKYIFATNTANYKSNVNTLRIYEDKEHVENGTISVGGFKLTFGDVLTGNKLVEFKAALGSVRHNISINELGTLEEDSRLIEGGILTTNAYTDPNGQYYVQPYIEVNDPQGYIKPEVKVEPISATTATNITPVVDPKTDIERRRKEELKNKYGNNLELISSKNETVIQRNGIWGLDKKDYKPQQVPTKEIFEEFDKIIAKYDAELDALENTIATTKQEIVPPNQPRHDISNIKINDSDDWAESRTKLEGGEINQASLKALNKILPGLTVANAKLAEEVGKNMKDTYGMFHNMLIYLFKGATNQTLFHEAFHGVFRNILSDTERKAVLDEAIKKYDKPDAARLQFLRDGKGNANLSDEILTQLHYEERLADDFGKHADGVFNPSLGQRILNFFNKIVDLFNVFRNANTDQINNLFEAVTKGKFATRSIVAKLANKAIDLNDFGGAYKRVLNTSDLEIPLSVELERTNSIANQVLDGIAKELAKGVPMSKISISKITFKIREQYKLVFAIENAKSKDEFNPQLYKISYAVDLKFGEIFENVKKQIALTRKLHIKGDFIDTTEIEGAEDTATESENIDNMQGNESKGFQEQTVISGIRSATQDIKLFLSNIPVIDKDGVVQMDNFGFTLFHSYEKLYYKLESSLVGTTSFVEQMKIMKELAPFSNEIKQIIDAVEAITDPQVAKNFKQQFAANFNKQVLNYKLITYSKKGTKYIFKMLNPNRKDVALNLKTQWTSTNITDATNLATNDIRTFNENLAIYEVSKNKVQALLDNYWAKGENTKGGKILTPKLTVDEVYELAQKLGIGLSFDSIELYSSLEEANLVNLTKDLLDYGKYMYVENKFSPARNTLTKLINLETNVQTELFTSSFNNVENSVVYAVQHQSFASKLVKALNSKEASSSALVKELERDPMNFGNIILANKNKLEMFALDGLKMQGDNITGKKFNQIHEDDYLAMVINMYDNPSAKGGNTTEETAVYAPIIPAEKGLSFGFTGVKIEVNKRDGKIPADSQIVKEFTQLFFNELSRIRQVMVDIKTLPENKLISNVHLGKKLGLEFNLPNAISPELKTKLDAFLEKTLNETIPTGVNPSEYVRGLLENTADKKTVELMSKVTESIISNLENIAQYHIELALNSDVIQEKDGVLTSDKIETTNVEKLITEWALNSTLFNVSQSMLINGDPAFYKGAEDNGKRFYQGFSMLKFDDTSTIDESYKYLKGGKMKINVIADVEEGTRSTQDLADIAKENNLPNVQKLANDHYNTKVDKDGKVKNPLNATDAQLFVSVGIYEELKRVFGISSEELSEGFSNADLANAMNSVLKSQQGILDIIKPFFYGVQWNEEYQRYIPIQVKCSIFPLTNKYVANNPLLAEHKALMDADENYPQVMAFHSSMKAFLPSKADILTPNKTSIVELDLNNFGEQVANPDHMLDSHNSSLRQMKMLMYGMVAEVDAQGNDLMYGDKTGRQIKDEIAMLDKANIEEALGKVVEAFEGNNKEFNDFIQNAITSRNSTSIIEAVFEQKPDGTFSYPLGLINSKATIQLISSIFSKRVVRQEFKGGAAVQVSSVGLQIAPKASDYKNAKAFQEAVDASPELTKLQTSLSWIRKGDVDANGKVSSIDYIEAYAPAHAKEFINPDGSFKDNIPEELRQMLIYRIPYEGAHSSMVIKVIGFLPIEYKGAMLLPYEVTQQFGADFDFDKIYFIVKDFMMSKDGKFKIYKYIDGTDNASVSARYQELIKYILKNDKNARDLIKVTEKEEDFTLNDEDKLDLLLKANIIPSLDAFRDLSVADQNIKPARDNKILDNYMQILRSVNMLESLITPSGPGAIADVYEHVEESEDHGNYFTPGHQVYLKALFHKISMLKGVSALQVTGHAWATEGNLVIKPVTVKIDGVVTVVERGVKVFKKNAEGKNEVELKNNLSKIMSDTGNKIVEEISSLMAVILDAVKTPNQLPSIGISIKTLPMWSYLVRLGFGSKVASQFTSQQAIKDLSEALESNDRQLKGKDFVKQDINTVKAEYVQKYQEAYDALYAEHKPKEGTSYDSRKIIEFLEKNESEKISYYNTLSLENLEKYSTLSPEELAKKRNEKSYISVSQANTSRTGIDKLKYLQSQIVALNIFKESEDVIKELGKLNQLFSINKETGPNFEDVNSKKASYDSLVKDDTVIAGIGQLLNSDAIKPYVDTINAQFEIMSKHYNFASPFFNNIKNYLAKLQYGDNADLTRIPAEDREVINGFIQMFLDAEETFSNIYEDENRISEEDFINDLKVLMSKKIYTTYKYKIFGNKELSAKAQEQLKSTTLLKSLEVVPIKNSKQNYLALKGNRYELAQKEMMIDEIVRLYNSKYKALAVRLIEQAFQDNGFFSGLHSYSGLIHPSVLQDMGLTEGRNKIRPMVQSTSTNIGRIERIIDQLVRNNAKKFTRVYDNNQKLFTEVEGGKTIVVDMNSKDSRLKSELVRSSETNKHPMYIRYTLSDKFTPIYKLDKEATEESGQITYRQVSYLGSPAKKIEINPFSDEVETKFPNNKYEEFVVKDKTGLFGGKSEKELAAEFGEDETTPVPEAPEVETESNTENIIDGQAEIEPEGKLKSAEDLANEWGDDSVDEENPTLNIYAGTEVNNLEGIDFVFEQNPELANAVYEALVFDNYNVELKPYATDVWGNVPQQRGDNSFVAKEQYSIKLGEDKGIDIRLTIYFDDINKTAFVSNIENFENNRIHPLKKGLGLKGFLKANQLIINRGYTPVVDNLVSGYGYDMLSKLEKSGYLTKVLDKKVVNSQYDSIKYERRPFIFTNKIYKPEITPQQKQQAQQLYSQYLEQNPNGSVEEFKEFAQGKSFDKELAQKIQDILQKLYPEIQLNITNNPVWEKGDNIFNQTIENEMGEEYWKDLYSNIELSNREEFESVRIPTIKNKYKPDYENIYHGTNNYHLDIDGNLILTPSHNFENKTESISLTQIPVVAQDYMLRKQGNVIIKISNNALPSNYTVESAEEIAINGNKPFIVKKGMFEIIKVQTLAEKMKAKYANEVEQRAEELKAGAISDLNLLDAIYSKRIAADNYSEIQEYENDSQREQAPDWYVPDEYLDSRAANKVYSDLKNKINKDWIIKAVSDLLIDRIKNTGEVIPSIESALENISQYGNRYTPHQSTLWEELLSEIGLGFKQTYISAYDTDEQIKKAREKTKEKQDLIDKIEELVKNSEKSSMDFYNSKEQKEKREEQKRIDEENHKKWLQNLSKYRQEIDELPFQKHNGKIIGQANIKAMSVLIDAVNQKDDTLPHEYAHHYIAWFRDAPIVQEAIKKWGSEETLVQSIGEQVVKQKGEAYNWWNNFVKWIMNQFNSLSKLQKEELTQILTDAFLTRQDLNNIGNNSFQQFQQSLNNPNTNPILQGNQQEQVKKFAELQERLNNKEFLEGAKNAFESSEELQQFGTQEQYNDYIARVSLGIIKNPSSGEYNYYSKVKDIVYHGTTVEFDKFDKSFIKRDGVNSFGDKFYFLPKDMLHMIFKRQRIIPVLLNMKSYTDYFEQGTYETNNNIRRFEEGILEELAVNEPEQIHILGSKQDIEGFKKFKNINTEVKKDAEEVYSKLGKVTKSEHVVIKPWGELKDATKAITPQGIVSTRIPNTNEHFGNPFSHDPVGKTQGLIKTETVKEAVEKYIEWLTTDKYDFDHPLKTMEDTEFNSFHQQIMKMSGSTNKNTQEQFSLNLLLDLLNRKKWIRKQIESGELKGKPILYYKELGEPSHATALDYLINKYNWDKKNNLKSEEKSVSSTIINPEITQNKPEGLPGIDRSNKDCNS